MRSAAQSAAMKNWFTIKAAVEGAATEVSILDYIGMWGVNAQQFLSELRAAKPDRIKCYINSPGGSVFEALAIFNGMRALKVPIEMHILGVAASAASYIAMAGDKIVMPANTYLFVHNPINAVYGNADDMREMADLLDKIGTGLTAAYARRFTGEASKLEQMLKDETYLSAAECLEMGLCDEVIPEVTAEAAFDVDRLPEALQAVFKKAQAAPEPTEPVARQDIADLVGELVKGTGLEAYAGVFATAPAAADKASVLALIEDAQTIKKLAEMTACAEMADGLIRGRKTLTEARALLADAQAARDEATFVNTAAPSKPAAKSPDDGISATSIWNDINSMNNRSKQ